MTPEQFKANRKALNLNKKQLADKLDISIRHIDYIENGDRKPSGVLIRCFELSKYILQLKEMLNRHIKEIEKDIKFEPQDYKKEFYKGQIDAYRFILKNIKLAKI